MINLHPSYLNNPIQTVMFLKATVAILLLHRLLLCLFTFGVVYAYHDLFFFKITNTVVFCLISALCGTAMLHGTNVLSPSCLLYFEKVEHK